MVKYWLIILCLNYIYLILTVMYITWSYQHTQRSNTQVDNFCLSRRTRQPIAQWLIEMAAGGESTTVCYFSVQSAAPEQSIYNTVTPCCCLVPESGVYLPIPLLCSFWNSHLIYIKKHWTLAKGFCTAVYDWYK